MRSGPEKGLTAMGRGCQGNTGTALARRQKSDTSPLGGLAYANAAVCYCKRRLHMLTSFK
jgi:hypothetical protein